MRPGFNTPVGRVLFRIWELDRSWWVWGCVWGSVWGCDCAKVLDTFCYSSYWNTKKQFFVLKLIPASFYTYSIFVTHLIYLRQWDLSYSLVLVHLILFWLVWSEIKCMLLYPYGTGTIFILQKWLICKAYKWHCNCNLICHKTDTFVNSSKKTRIF